MPAPQISSILSLPTDLLLLMSSYLGRAIVPFRTVCSRFRTVSTLSFEAYKERLFVARNGARADCEKDIPLEILIERIESASAIKKTLTLDYFRTPDVQIRAQLEQIRDLKLTIDLHGVPRLVKDDLLQISEEKVKNLVQLQDAVASEFITKPLNPLHPLQDLRDRCLRLQNLQAERESLSQALQASSKSNNVVLGNLLVSRASLNVRGVKFAETKITFEGQEIPVEVTAGFSSDREHTFYERTIFIVRRKDNQATLGSFHIEKRWTHIRPDGVIERHYTEGVKDAEKDVGTLHPRLFIIHFENQELKQDSTTGDRPIMRLLTQIAVEVFQLEAGKDVLEIGSNFCDADVYMAGGFAILNPRLRADRIKNDIQAARANNKLFPNYRHLTSFDLYLGKSSTNAVSRFVTWNARKEEVPAMVDFSLDHPPTTWEEQIAKNRLLPEKGPILPKFFTQDLSRFEKTLQKP
jgi:hypothetical protein